MPYKELVKIDRPKWSLCNAFTGWGDLLQIAIPSAVMMASEWLSWEVMLFFAGLLCEGDSSCPDLDVFPIVSNLMVLNSVGAQN